MDSSLFKITDMLVFSSLDSVKKKKDENNQSGALVPLEILVRTPLVKQLNSSGLIASGGRSVWHTVKCVGY